jgi:hypothetical protein
MRGEDREIVGIDEFTRSNAGTEFATCGRFSFRFWVADFSSQVSVLSEFKIP